MRNQYSMGIRGKTGVSPMALRKRCRIRLPIRKGDLDISVKKRAGTILYDAVSQSAGTGYGREEYSPSRQVGFDPERKAVETLPIKYEWRATPCSKRIIHCGTTYEHTRNRL